MHLFYASFCFAALVLPTLYCWTVLAWKRKNRQHGGLRRVTKTHLLDGDECCICLERFVLGKVVAELNCEHIFHRHCIQPWFKLQNTCPLCRKEVDLSKSAEPSPRQR